VTSIEKRIARELEAARESGLVRGLRGVESLSARECLVGAPPRKCLDFSSNNYLGLSDDPRLKDESVRWTERYGTGSRASRLVSGTSPFVLELEERVAEWKGFESALIFGSGHMANLGAVPALVGRGGAVFADRLNHASLNDGCRLSGARFFRYRHADSGDLEEKLDSFLSRALAKGSDTDYRSSSSAELLVVSDTVFSMDGDVADVAGIADAARGRGALVYFDDAHATGVFGERGEGLASPVNADVAMGTFSKGLGCHGAYVACSRRLRDWLVNKCGSFVYSTAPPPSVYGAISAALDLMETDEFRGKRAELLAVSAETARRIRDLGFDVGKTATPIIPVVVGKAEDAVGMSRALLERGIFAPAIRPPTVPRGSARLRVSLNAAHTGRDLDALVGALGEVAKHGTPT